MRRVPLLLASLLGLLLALACGDPSRRPERAIEVGYSALETGRYEEALTSFEGALEHIGAQHARYGETKLGQLRALCHLDSLEARNELFGAAESAGFEARHYGLIAVELIAVASRLPGPEAAASVLQLAIDVLQAGRNAFPEGADWEALILKTRSRLEARSALDRRGITSS